MMAEFRIVPVAELSAKQIVAVINDAFGRNESVDWFRWKHQDGPWGPSLGVAAVDRDGPIGVRLLLPWRFRHGDASYLAHRATEAATIPRAQGRGVFTALNAWMMDEVRTELIFSTPNTKSRTGYIKLGWRPIANVGHRWELITRRNRFGGSRISTSAGMATDWTEHALGWRSDPRSGQQYSVTSSAESRLYYRTLTRRGLRNLAPHAATGELDQLGDLWRDMLGRTRARMVLRPTTQPVPGPPIRLSLHRGESLVLGWLPRTSRLLTAAPLVDTIPWTAADLEGVI